MATARISEFNSLCDKTDAVVNINVSGRNIMMTMTNDNNKQIETLRVVLLMSRSSGMGKWKMTILISLTLS